MLMVDKDTRLKSAPEKVNRIEKFKVTVCSATDNKYCEVSNRTITFHLLDVSLPQAPSSCFNRSFLKRMEGRMRRKQEFCYAVGGWGLDKDLWLSFQFQASKCSTVHHLYIKVPLPFNALDKSAQMIISLTRCTRLHRN